MNIIKKASLLYPNTNSHYTYTNLRQRTHTHTQKHTKNHDCMDNNIFKEI